MKFEEWNVRINTGLKQWDIEKEHNETYITQRAVCNPFLTISIYNCDVRNIRYVLQKVVQTYFQKHHVVKWDFYAQSLGATYANEKFVNIKRQVLHNRI